MYRQYGYDFRNYAYSSLKRRIHYYTQRLNIENISELQGKILYDPKLMEGLSNVLSITVTEMFRDPSFFEAFRSSVIPDLKDVGHIRIWHAGCASGEEVYSMAILLHEAGLYEKSIIYATDINEQILEKAKEGKFPLKKMQQYTKNYLASGGTKEFSKYYSCDEKFATIHSFLKENIVFAHHNLATDHSFNEFHIIICRNVIIYFNKQLKERVFQLFYESLTEGGYLGLGSKESLIGSSYSEQFLEVDDMSKLFIKGN